MNWNPRSNGIEIDNRHRAVTSYIRGNYHPEDRVAIVLKNPRTGEETQRMSQANEVVEDHFQDWLEQLNRKGFDLYLSANAFGDGSHDAHRDNISTIRHIYVDFESNGHEAVGAVLRRQDLPTPSYIVACSPAHWYATWNTRGFEKGQAEELQNKLVRSTGGNRDASDPSSVLRLPYFLNHSELSLTIVQAEPHSAIDSHVFTPEDFEYARVYKQEPIESGRPPPNPRASEEIWAFDEAR